MENLIYQLVSYALDKGLISPYDVTYAINSLASVLEVRGFSVSFSEYCDNSASRPLADILNDICDLAMESGLITDDSVTMRDLFDTKVMGIVTPRPSEVIGRFKDLYDDSPEKATAYFYKLALDSNYIRADRMARDVKWVTDTEYGPVDITINLAKPEKDPKAIAQALKMQKTGYPACLLCRENEGFEGNISHPARQNLRLIPLSLSGHEYYLQYSPYVYYNEHCIVLSKDHVPMKIDHTVFDKLLDFIEQFPYYTVGSNADLPIVGGSILSHDHFQGGRYEFAMAKAGVETVFGIPGFTDISAGIVKWPLSVIRLTGSDREGLSACAGMILDKWRQYSDESAGILAETSDKHNTITPIARRRGDLYELDLVLRNNRTDDDHPWGIFHPTEDLHHIKKENIGLIEVMGLAVLPSRLKKEFSKLAEYILEGKDLDPDPDTAGHAAWVESWMSDYDISKENIDEIIRKETGLAFVKVLECCGVFKRTEEGREAFARFIDSL